MKKNSFRFSILILLLISLLCTSACFGKKDPAEDPSSGNGEVSDDKGSENSQEIPDDSQSGTPETPAPEETDPPVSDSDTEPSMPETDPPVSEDTSAVETDPEEIIVTPPTAFTKSGKFVTDTNTNLILTLEWTLKASADGSRTLDVALSLSHYQIYIGARERTGTMTVNGIDYAFSTPNIAYDLESYTTTPLFSQTIPVTAGDLTVDVVWPFMGTYSDVYMENISVGGIITSD